MTDAHSQSPRGPALVELSKRIARRAHSGQFRRGGITPTLLHAAAVASRVRGDADAEALAWLHDVLEDTTETTASLRAAGVPEHLLRPLRLLTKAKDADYDRYLKAIQSDTLATQVKIADLLSNLADAPSPGQVRKYARALLLLVPEVAT